MDDQELDGLYARLRDAEDARKAAVGVIEKQNAELTRLKVAANKDVCPGCMLREEQRESMQHVARETGLKLLQVKESATHWMEQSEAAEAVIRRQNDAIARVRALCYEPVPCPTHDHLCPDDVLKALNA